MEEPAIAKPPLWVQIVVAALMVAVPIALTLFWSSAPA